MEILRHAVKNPGPPPPPPAAPGLPRDMSIVKQLAAAADQLKDRTAVRAQVFRPGHALPTMSLQELAEQEVAEAGAREARQAAAATAQRRRQAAHEEWGEDEEIIRKDRAWDDFKDDNPFGHGNSAVRPLR